MATIVLIHGAWHGGWCWKKVVPLLRRAGHDVYAPTLTGLGERSHLLSRDVDLSTHVRDVLGLLEYEDLVDVTLVGHSYGGMVITGVAHERAKRLVQLVYLDAYVPRDGEALVDHVSSERRAHLRAQVDAARGEWALPGPSSMSWEEVVRTIYLVKEEEDVKWMLERLVPHPYRTWTQPVVCSDPAAAALPRTYVRCTRYPNSAFDAFATAARAASSGWQHFALDTGHDPMVTMPGELSEVLLGLV